MRTLSKILVGVADSDDATDWMGCNYLRRFAWYCMKVHSAKFVELSLVGVTKKGCASTYAGCGEAAVSFAQTLTALTCLTPNKMFRTNALTMKIRSKSTTVLYVSKDMFHLIAA